MPNNVTYSYVKQPRYGDSIRVRVTPRKQGMSLDQRLVAVAEMCIINRIATDYADRLYNVPIVKEKFKMHGKDICWRFNDLRRKMNRQMYNERDKGHFDDCVCAIVDDTEKSLDWVETMIKSELVGVIKYEFIDVVFCISFLRGFVDILKNVQMCLYARHDKEYDDILETIDYVNNSLGEVSLNGETVRLASIEEAMTKLFKEIKEKSIAFVAQAKKERELCLSVTKEGTK